MALSDFDVINVDIRNAYPVFLEIFSHELNANGGRVLKLKFYEGNTLLNLTGLTITATFVTDGYLVAEDVAVTQGANNICTLDISNTSNYTLLSGTMLVEFKFTATGDVVYCPPTAMIVKVAESIMTNAHVTPESYGTVSEILQEVVEARGNFSRLNLRFNSDETLIANNALEILKRLELVQINNSFNTQSDFNSYNFEPSKLYSVLLGANVLYNGYAGGRAQVLPTDNSHRIIIDEKEGIFTARIVGTNWVISRSNYPIIENKTGDAFGTAIELDKIYRIEYGGTDYILLNVSETEQVRFEYTIGIETRHKVNDNWQAWETLILPGQSQALSDFLQLWNSTDYVNVIDAGTLEAMSDLNNPAYCSESTVVKFIPGDTVKFTLFGFGSSVDVVCEMTYNNGIQALKAYTDSSRIVRVRTITSITPTFSAGAWANATISGADISDGSISFAKFNQAFQQRIENLETGKADYSNINAIFDSSGNLLNVSGDSNYPTANSDADSIFIDKKVTTINKSVLLTMFPNLTTIYVDNYENDVTITGTGTFTFVFKGNFNAGQLLYLGISKAINDTDTRLATLENTVGTVNSILQNVVDGGASNA